MKGFFDNIKRMQVAACLEDATKPIINKEGQVEVGGQGGEKAKERAVKLAAELGTTVADPKLDDYVKPLLNKH